MMSPSWCSMTFDNTRTDAGGLSVEQPTWTNTSVLRRVLAVSLLPVWKWKKCQPFGLKSKLFCCLSGKFDLLIGFIWYAPITCCPFFSHYNSSHDAMMPNSFILWCQKHWLTIRSVVTSVSAEIMLYPGRWTVQDAACWSHSHAYSCRLIVRPFIAMPWHDWLLHWFGFSTASMCSLGLSAN